MSRVFSRGLYGVLLVVMLAAGAAAQAQTQLLPDFDNTRLRFGTGKVADNKPQISAVTPAIPGALSGWSVIEWSHFALLTPDSMTANDPAAADPALGPASYAFTAPDRFTHLWIYKNAPGGHPVYELFEQDGSLGNGGGRNLFLSAGVTQPVTMDHAVQFSMQVKVSRAAVSYDTPSAKKTGAVLGMAFAGFILKFPSPLDGSPSTWFLQVDIANSPNKARLKTACKISKAGKITLLTGGYTGGVPPLPFQADPGPLHNVTFSINDYVNTVLSQPLQCQVKGEGLQPVSLTGIAPGQIDLKSVYIGLETENSDHRPTSQIQGPQGTVQLGLQLSGIHMTE